MLQTQFCLNIFGLGVAYLSLPPARLTEFKEVLLTARVPATLCFTRLEMRAVVGGRSPLPLEAGLADTSSRHVVAVAVKTRAAQEAAAVPKRPVGAGRLAPGETERRQEVKLGIVTTHIHFLI